MSKTTRISHEDALEMAFAGRLKPYLDYLEVPTALFVGQIDLKMPALPAVTFYVKVGEKIEALRRADQPYSPLALTAHPFILIEKADAESIRRYAEHFLLNSTIGQKPVTTGEAPKNVRIESLRKAAVSVVEDLFLDPSPENIRRSQRLVGSFVYVLMRDPAAYSLLSRLRSHDPYTLQHSVGTAVNSIILARKLGINGERELNEVGLAGLFHDLGKTKVPVEIINKEGPLDAQEWEIMKRHPEIGYELLKDNPDVPERTKLAVLEHHEDKKGTGYPAGKKHDAVDLYSKIVCISDIFNALTTNRSYARARDPFSAFELMRDKLMYKIDQEMFSKLVKIYGGDFADIEALPESATSAPAKAA